MGWSRSLALSGREPFPYPIAQVEKKWELTFPHEPIDSLPTTRQLNPITHEPPQPTGPQAFVQRNQNVTVPIPVPPPIPPAGGPIP